MTRTRAALLALAVSASLAACTDDPAGTPVSAQTVAPGTAAPSPQGAPSPSAAAPSTPTAAAPALFPADTALDEQEPSGGPLTVRAVRVARQRSYDRVVFELAGKTAGAPGWRVEYVDKATSQGSGEEVAVRGEHTLQVMILGTGYPMDTGVDEVEKDPAVPADADVVEQVVLGAVYEGQYEAFIGTSAKVPFRVFRLADPARVVVDLRRP
jgi:hypothetical protein